LDGVVLEAADGIVTITINRPNVLNALNHSGKERLGLTLMEQIADQRTRAIVITGSGRAFCAGTDIQEMEDFTASEAEEIFRLEYRLQEAIRNAPIPVVAAVNGYALGTGCVLAMCCDWSVASAIAKLGLPETTVGVPAAIQCALVYPLVGLSATRRLVFFGEHVSAQEAVRLGLVNEVVEDGEVVARALEVAKRLSAMPATAFRLQKQLIRSWIGGSLDRAMEDSIYLAVRAYSSGDVRQQVRKFKARKL
jgi:enoyl-CoA hydratase/carnithine racemase